MASNDDDELPSIGTRGIDITIGVEECPHGMLMPTIEATEFEIVANDDDSSKKGIRWSRAYCDNWDRIFSQKRDEELN